jgi:hypothetical protein
MAPPPRQKQYSFSEKQINQAVDNPEINRIKDELANMADLLRQEETPSEDRADDTHMQRRATQPRGRGPIGNRDKGARVDATTERTDRILKRLGEARGVDFSQHLSKPQEEDDYDDESEEGLPPPRPRPSGPGVAPQDKGLLTNRDAVFPQRGKPGLDERLSAPDLSRIQRLELELDSLKQDRKDEAAGKRVPTHEPQVGKLRFARKPTHTTDGFQKVDLQSDFLFYNWSRDDFVLRPVDAATQILVTNAKQAKDGVGDESMLYDALQNCAGPGIDLRQLTYPDLYYVLMWLQFNSYPNVPFDIDWTSKYGNLNKFTLEQHNLRYLRPSATREDIARWRAMGLDYPRVRDREILKSDLDPEDLSVYRRAQYFVGDTPEEKVDRFYSAPASVLAEYPKMLEKCNHGIFDHMDLVDQYYDPAVHVLQLRETARRIETDGDRYKEDPVFHLNLMSEAEGIRTRADEIEQSLKQGVRVEPDAERVTLVFSPLAFFPVL